MSLDAKLKPSIHLYGISLESLPYKKATRIRTLKILHLFCVMELNATLKNELLAAAQESLRQQINDIQKQLADVEESSEVEEKSSAGDKFETHQEMLNQTRDILQKRLSSSKIMLNQLNAVPVKSLETIQEGALIKVPMGFIWVSVPMGKVSLNGTDFQLVSLDSPLITALWGKKKGESGEFRGKAIPVLDLV